MRVASESASLPRCHRTSGHQSQPRISWFHPTPLRFSGGSPPGNIAGLAWAFPTAIRFSNRVFRQALTGPKARDSKSPARRPGKLLENGISPRGVTAAIRAGEECQPFRPGPRSNRQPSLQLGRLESRAFVANRRVQLGKAGEVKARQICALCRVLARFEANQVGSMSKSRRMSKMNVSETRSY